MRRTMVAAALVLAAGVIGTPAAHPAEDATSFSAEVFATPSYHVLELPKVEEGGEGFSWAYVNQSPESWGRSVAFWPGHLADVLLRTSVPQQGPLAGHGWRTTPGAWQSYPPGGDGAGAADFGGALRFPLGTTVDTPGGRFQVLSLTGQAQADEGIGAFSLSDLSTTLAPLRVGFARSFAHARRDRAAAVSTGWALLHDVRAGDITIDEIRSDAEVRATASGSTSTWRLTVAGVAVSGHRLAWTDGGVSFAPGSEAALDRLNEEFARGAEPARSELRLVPGQTWVDDTGAHARSGFLQMGHRPLIAENNPGQRLAYSLSVVSAQARYHPAEVDGEPIDAAPDLPPTPSSGAADTKLRVAPEMSPGRLALGDAAREPGVAPSSAVREQLPAAGSGAATGAIEPPEEVAQGAVSGQDLAQGTLERTALSGLGVEAAKRLRGTLDLAVFLGAIGVATALRAARRQLALIASSREEC